MLVFPANVIPGLAPCWLAARWCRERPVVSLISQLKRNTLWNSETWRSKALFSIFSPSPRRRSPNRRLVPRRPRQTCRPPSRSPARLRKSKLNRQLNKNQAGPATASRKAAPSMRKLGSTSYLATRPQHPNKSKSTPGGGVTHRETRFLFYLFISTFCWWLSARLEWGAFVCSMKVVI